MESLWIVEKAIGLMKAALELVNNFYSIKLSRRQLASHKLDKPQADVRITLEEDRGRDWFVVANRGTGDAREACFEIITERPSPLVEGDYDEKIPIPVLRPGDRVQVLAAVAKDTGTAFDVRWQWLEVDDTLKKRFGRVAL